MTIGLPPYNYNLHCCRFIRQPGIQHYNNSSHNTNNTQPWPGTMLLHDTWPVVLDKAVIQTVDPPTRGQVSCQNCLLNFLQWFTAPQVWLAWWVHLTGHCWWSAGAQDGHRIISGHQCLQCLHCHWRAPASSCGKFWCGFYQFEGDILTDTNGSNFKCQGCDQILFLCLTRLLQNLSNLVLGEC